MSPRLRVNRHFARIHGDHELENRVEELLVTPDPSEGSEGNDNKVPLSPRKKYTASDMLAEKVGSLNISAQNLTRERVMRC